MNCKPNSILFVSFCNVILAGLALQKPPLVAQNVSAKDVLINAEEIFPGWQVTPLSYKMEDRDFIIYYGAKFKGLPPDTPGFSFQWNGKAYNSLGILNNDLVRSIVTSDRDQKKEVEQIKKIYQELYGQFPDQIPVAFNLARLHYTLYEFAQARQIYERLAQKMPEYAGIHYHLALSAIHLNEDTRVRYHLEQCYKRDPRRVRAVVAMGDFYAHQSSWHLAQVQYEKALAINPDSIPALIGLVRLMMDQRKYNQARRKMMNFEYDFIKQDQEKISDGQAYFFYYLAELNYVLRDCKRALPAYRKSLKLPSSLLFWQISRSSIEKRIRKCGS